MERATVSQIRIVLVDDDATFLKIAGRFLGRFADLSIVGTGHDGREAVACATTLHPDVVVLDVSMTGMGGLEALACLRQTFPALGLIVLTQYDLEAYRAAALATGANDFVVKNNLALELVPAIRQVASDVSQRAPSLAANAADWA
jgi:DNA-binding NarL/FixJ family response regulator